MKRVIVDYAKLTNEILNLLVDKFPDGYDDSDIISFKNAKNEYYTDFIQCELWGHNADFLEKNFSKGDMVAFVGAIRNNNYEKDGVKHYSNKIVVESVYFTGSTLMKKKQ